MMMKKIRARVGLELELWSGVWLEHALFVNSIPETICVLDITDPMECSVNT